MSKAEARDIVAAYNVFVRLWNTHEKATHLPPLSGDDWAYARLPHTPQLPHNVLAFCPRHMTEYDMGAIAVAGWTPFEDGWSFRKRTIDASAIMWGGWEIDSYE